MSKKQKVKKEKNTKKGTYTDVDSYKK